MNFFLDLKKLIKYEAASKSSIERSPIRQAPENVINVTIINESPHKEKKDDEPEKLVRSKDSESQPASATTTAISSVKSKRRKDSKKLLLLPRHVKTKNTHIVYKNRGGSANSGILVRNTPTDLYQKYQNDWDKFKSFIPGENVRRDVRESVRSMMQQKVGEPPKVCLLSILIDSLNSFNDKNMFFLFSGLRLFC